MTVEPIYCTKSKRRAGMPAVFARRHGWPLAVPALGRRCRRASAGPGRALQRGLLGIGLVYNRDA